MPCRALGLAVNLALLETIMPCGALGVAVFWLAWQLRRELFVSIVFDGKNLPSSDRVNPSSWPFKKFLELSPRSRRCYSAVGLLQEKD